MVAAAQKRHLLTCQDCGYQWMQRFTSREPLRCANLDCRSWYWRGGDESGGPGGGGMHRTPVKFSGNRVLEMPLQKSKSSNETKASAA